MTRSTSFPIGLVATTVLAACTGNIGDGDADKTNTAESTLCVVDTPIRRLTRFEYNNTVRDLFGDTTEPASALPPEEEVGGFNNQAAALTVSDFLADQYLKIAEGISVRATADLAVLQPDCDATADGEEFCADRFIEETGRKVFRRPLAADETARLRALYDSAKADPDIATHTEAMQMVIQAMLQSPSFLYRPEFGGADPVEADVVRLSDHEMASKLSYMLWNTMPDDTLFAAADSGQLNTKEQIADQARRLLKDDRAKDALRNFHRQWLLLTHLDTASKDVSLFPAYYDGLRPLWSEEVEAFAEHVILDESGTLTELLTAPYSMMNAELASFYGDDVVGELPTGTEFEKVMLDPAHRAGLMTQGGLMAALAYGNQTSPVHRGKFVREQLLCQGLPLPPADLVIVPPELDSTKTTREQFEEINAAEECAGCHALMNPVGFGFENFDAIGQWRDEQNGKPIDASGSVIATVDINPPEFNGAAELAQKLAGSQQVADCVMTQYFRFSYNRTVTQEDSCSIDQLSQAFTASNYNIRELLVALTQTDAFLYRHPVVVEGGQP